MDIYLMRTMENDRESFPFTSLMMRRKMEQLITVEWWSSLLLSHELSDFMKHIGWARDNYPGFLTMIKCHEESALIQLIFEATPRILVSITTTRGAMSNFIKFGDDLALILGISLGMPAYCRREEQVDCSEQVALNGEGKTSEEGSKRTPRRLGHITGKK